MGGQNDFIRPGWTKFASDLYDMSRDVYFLWKDSGSPRQGELFDMKNRAVMTLIAILNHVDTDTIITGLLAITMQSDY